VGDDVNATMLDQLAEQTRALSTFVRPAEDIEVKVQRTLLQDQQPGADQPEAECTNDISLGRGLSGTAARPVPRLPARGGSVVTAARTAAIKLKRHRWQGDQGVVYELTFPDRPTTSVTLSSICGHVARSLSPRQIRANGEKDERVKETVTLAKKYGITTPYTSWLIVPDAPVPVVMRIRPGCRHGPVDCGSTRCSGTNHSGRRAQAGG